MGFRITGGKGFHIIFDNNVVVSVQFGAGNYCDNYDLDILPFYNGKTKERVESSNAEIAIFRKDGDWLTRDYKKDAGDDVLGYIDVNEFYKILTWARKLKKEEKENV